MPGRDGYVDSALRNLSDIASNAGGDKPMPWENETGTPQ
jgi:hypothetical protein